MKTDKKTSTAKTPAKPAGKKELELTITERINEVLHSISAEQTGRILKSIKKSSKKLVKKIFDLMKEDAAPKTFVKTGVSSKSANESTGLKRGRKPKAVTESTKPAAVAGKRGRKPGFTKASFASNAGSPVVAASETPKKKMGRPATKATAKKNEDGNDEAPKKRGRKPGFTKASFAAKSSTDVSESPKKKMGRPATKTEKAPKSGAKRKMGRPYILKTSDSAVESTSETTKKKAGRPATRKSDSDVKVKDSKKKAMGRPYKYKSSDAENSVPKMAEPIRNKATTTESADKTSNKKAKGMKVKAKAVKISGAKVKTAGAGAKRGRKPGQKNKTAADSNALNTDNSAE